MYVKTPARLHFGLIDMRGDLGRFFGGLGMGIDRPNVILEARASEVSSVTGEKTQLVTSLVRRFLEAYHLKGNVRLHVTQTIPRHVGLGSGTQLALAVATALAELFQVEASPLQLSFAMGRMQRTRVGTAIFRHGGLVVDGGKKVEGGSVITESLSPLIFREKFPENWKFIVAVPEVEKGLSDVAEEEAFDRLPPMSSERVGRICRLTMMKLLPALIDRDIESFGEALTRIQKVVGEYFAGVQGGTFSSSPVAEGINLLKECGAYGVGQSSWGPTFYGLVHSGERVENLRSRVENFLQEGVGGEVFTANPNNGGAVIKHL